MAKKNKQQPVPPLTTDSALSSPPDTDLSTTPASVSVAEEGTEAVDVSVVLEWTAATDYKQSAEACQKLAKGCKCRIEWVIVLHSGMDTAAVSTAQQALAAVKLSAKWMILTEQVSSGTALRAGVSAAIGNHILTIDALSAAQPDAAISWLASEGGWSEDSIWVASRATTKGVPLLRRWWWSFWNFIVRFFTSLQIRDTQAGMLLFPAAIAKGLFALVRTPSVHYRTTILYKAHLQDIPLIEKTLPAAQSGGWDKLKQVPSFKWGVFKGAWSVWLRHYFVEPLQRSATAQLPQTESPLYRWGFASLMLLLLVLMPLLSLDYGMTGDEHVQRVYGEYVLSYYETGGDDDRALTYKDLYNYGGLFDYWAAWFNKYIGWLETYDGRHFLNSLVGVFLFFFIGLTARLVSGRWSVALWALIFAICSPRLFGDSMNNPKDIPFAAAYIFTIFHILRFIQQMPHPALKNIFWIAVGIAAAINIRIGGLLLIAYFGLFVGLAFLFKKELRAKLLHLPTLFKTALIGVTVSALGFWWGTAYWPYGALSPFTAPFTVLDKMSDYYVGIRIMFNGESIWSDTVPPSYIPIWMLYTSPLFVLLGMAMVPVVALITFRKSPILLLLLLSFAALFPIGYVIYLQSGLYDGMRHMLFAYTLFPILAAWAWLQWATLLQRKKAVIIGLSVIMGGMASMPLLFMIRNHPYQYVYFNELAGGMMEAKNNFDVDYWMTSMRALSDWLVSNEPKIAAGDTLRVGTNCYEPVNYYFKRAEYKAKQAKGYRKSYQQFIEDYAQDKIWNTAIVYTRYHERERHNWDYGIYYPRFIDKEFLLSGAYPPQQVVHAEEVDGAPIGVVVKRPTKEGYEAHKAMSAKDFDTAIRLFESVVRENPKNESGWLYLMQGYANKMDMPNMKRCVDQVFKLSDRYGTAYGWLGTYYLNINQLDSAQAAFDKAIYYDYKYTLPYFQMARILSQPGREDPKKALDYLEKFDEYGGKPQEGYDVAIQIATNSGDKVRQLFFTAKKSGLKNFNQALKELNACVALDPTYEPAVKAKKLYDESLKKQNDLLKSYRERTEKAKKAKDQVRAMFFYGKQLEIGQKTKEALDAYRKTLQLDPEYVPAILKIKELEGKIKD